MLPYDYLIPLHTLLILYIYWDSTLIVSGNYTRVIEEASYEYKFKLHSHPDLDICNETVRCMMLSKGNIDEDFVRYFVLKLGAIILNAKKRAYSLADKHNYTSEKRPENYEYYRQTGRSILHSINDWYLYVMNIVKLNTLADHRFEYLGTDAYANVSNCMRLHTLWAMETAFKDDMLLLGWRLKDRIRQQMKKLSQHYYYHSVGQILNYENLTYSMEKNELVYGE
ncbi:hypothetical protein M8J75_008844 [Diaphorina citri]|nr:hypothetical protein M8J75_008844 [Diaphorina citri]